MARIASPGGFLTALGTVSRLAGAVLLTLWAIAAATDYSTGLVRILVQAQPARTRLLAGKILPLAVFTLLAATVTAMVVVAIARPLARLEGIEVEAWKTDFLWHLVEGYFDFTVSVLVWGLIGLMLAVLTRSSALAIGIGIGFSPGRREPDHHRRFGRELLGGTLNAPATGGNDQLSWGASFGLVIVYGLIAAAVSLAVFHRRDITS